MNSIRCGVAVAIALSTAMTAAAGITIKVPNPKHPAGPPITVHLPSPPKPSPPKLPLPKAPSAPKLPQPVSKLHQSVQAALVYQVVPNSLLATVPKGMDVEDWLARNGLEMKAYCVKYYPEAMVNQPTDSSKNWNPPNPGGPPQAGPPSTTRLPAVKETYHSRLGIEDVRIRMFWNGISASDIVWFHEKGCEAPENQG